MKSAMQSKPSRSPLDDIRIFLPSVGDEEYTLRAKMRSYRNVASCMVHRSESNTARQLAWLVVDYATLWIYAAASEGQIKELNRFFYRLLITAMQAESIDLQGPES